MQISSTENIISMSRRKLMGECSIIVSLAVIALFTLGMFILNGYQRSYLFSSLLWATCAARGLMLVYPSLFPDFIYDSDLGVSFGYVLGSATYIFLMLLLRNLFPDRFSKWVVRLGVGLLSLYIVVVMIADPVFISNIAFYFRVTYALLMLYSITSLVSGLIRGNTRESLAFLGLSLMVALIINEAFGLFDLSNIGSHGLLLEGSMIMMLSYLLIFVWESAEKRYELETAHERERKITEDKALLEQINRFKTELLANIAHELKTPLTAVSNYAQLSGRRLGMADTNTEEIYDNMRFIKSEAEHMAFLVGQLQYATRLEEGRTVLDRTPAKISEVIDNTLDEYFEILNENNDKLELEIDESLPEVEIDVNQIRRVLVNLITNALKSTRNGIITVSASREGEDMVRVTIRDTGSGIDSSILPRVFDRYVKGQGDGGGLGLYISRNIIEAHGGRISAENSPSQVGAVLSFTLPVVKSS